MAVLRTLPRAIGGRKFSATRTSITGTGGVTTGLSSVDAGSISATPTNSATTIPTNLAAVSSISGGTVNAVVVAAAAAANTISGVAANVDVFCTGQ